MLKSFRKFVILALLLVMPLQGVAASLTEALCSSAPVISQPAEHGHDANAGAAHEHNDGTGTAHSSVLCCHHFFAALPVVAVDPGGSAPRAFDPQHRFSARLFIPEQPQRVPLA